jgi:uncharacterized protein (TIGR02646 family)
MRPIIKRSKPNILITKENEWLQKFLASNKDRPHNSQYGHPEIQTALYSSSYNKCYYCERELLQVPSEIDHFIEVNEDKTLAFKWENLYLSCGNCNDKLPNRDYPVTSVIDPCSTTQSIIENNLTFYSNIIKSRNNTQFSLDTITKYRLNSKVLNTARSTMLIFFYDKLSELYRKKDAERRLRFNDDELEFITSFANNDSQFSLMFKVLLKKMNFIP